MLRMEQIKGKNVVLKEGDLIRRENDNRDYLMRLKSPHLLRNFQLEAGRYSGRGMDHEAMGGWEDPSCQLRGHFLGHWLSAAAMYYEKSGDRELKAKAESIVEELALCQMDNGGEWACSIPEKYLYWLGKGKSVWAPQYTIHKLFMGLVDVYLYMDVKQALEVADHLADWFYRWSGDYTQEEFDNILDVETGGMMEVWVELYHITKDEKYKTLMDRYYRRRLFEPLLEGKDVLTNMHANTTIPEVLGCARAYEVTGEEKWLTIAEKYWQCAVTDRGCFATGGQTQGEIWTPMKKLKARLGDKNQEHCHFFCEVPSILSLACTDTSFTEMVVFIFSIIIVFIPFLLIIVSYTQILLSVLRMQSASGRQKALSTCASHQTGVVLFYGTAIFMYMRPQSKSSRAGGKIIVVFYTVIPPMLNPLIYSLRNQDVKGALRRAFAKQRA